MYVLPFRWRGLILATACLTCVPFVTASDEPTLTKEQIKHFLLTAKVVDSKQPKKGVTDTWRLTLSDGAVTHDASFQSIDKRSVTAEFANGQAEVNFVDSYKYNIAAYALAELLGLDDMLPVYVERKWQRDTGSLSWWLPVKMDEMERVKKKIPVKDIDAWNKQMYRIQVFDQLVYDTDPNLTNVLIGEDWNLED
jgi:hypothetical protein